MTLSAVFIAACGTNTSTKVIEEVPVTASYNVAGEDITVNVSDCNVIVKQNENVIPVDCNTNTASLKVVYLANHINVSTLDNKVILDDSFVWDVPTNEPDSLYMPYEASHDMCPIGRRPCGMHTNCIKISVYGY